MRTPKQLEKWTFSTKNSDNIKNKIENETFIEENFIGKCSNSETSSIDGISTTCSSCCLSQNIIKSLKQRLEKLELKLKLNDLALENNNLTLQNEHENEIKNLKQNFQKLFQENKKLKAENVDKIKALEEEIKKAIQELKTEHENEIKNLKQNFQKLIEANISQLKTENNTSLKQNDVKISSSEKGIKNDFAKFKNKWSEIESEYKFCDNTFVNSSNSIKKNGFVNLIDDENINYLKGKGGSDNCVFVYSENTFKKLQNYPKYYLYYFEIKCKFEGGPNRVGNLDIGLKNLNTNICNFYSSKYGKVKMEKLGKCQLFTDFNNNDIFGCGLVYPPNNKLNEEFPYVFFTQNGKQIGKYFKY